ncbi:hypothetical protein DH2020_000354 [Rehmannia glutinosa]|uniref:Uncharacterized protein n=1 Tax=Rehmannia glutinosa TaxID=99300 RepID=A0ABR0XWW5_REHGL
MDVSSGNLTKPVRKRNDKGRRSWSGGEEEALVAIPKEVDANARLMRNKSWPFYNDWVMIFGKDRATGEHAEDFTDALNHVLNGQSIPQDDYHVNLEILSDNCEYETETHSNCQAESTPQMSASGKKGAGGKRKSSDGVDPLYEIMRTFCQSTDARFGDIAKRIGYEYDISIARKEVFGVVGNMQGLSLRDKLFGFEVACQEYGRLRIIFRFFGRGQSGVCEDEVIGELINKAGNL